ncbi:MAG: hypothetical protein HUU21_23820, partial [Polyangiaceae bacterium]|nr:hypothetical protein [Polyangiaceae bacterium]
MVEVLLVGIAIAVIAAWVRGSSQDRRIDALEKELGHARRAYDGLLARVWYLERAVAERWNATGSSAPPAVAPAAGEPAPVAASVAASVPEA